jgi:hypothetical protein
MISDTKKYKVAKIGNFSQTDGYLPSWLTDHLVKSTTSPPNKATIIMKPGLKAWGVTRVSFSAELFIGPVAITGICV